MNSADRIAILGASRGLGLELTQVAQKWGEVLAISRRIEQSFALGSSGVKKLNADFSVSEGQQKALRALSEFAPTKIFYVAGGGPFGRFLEKDWSAHDWALQVTFLFPAQMVHSLCKQYPKCQVVLVGSSVAENQGDPLAASYSAAKHALLGLYRSIRLEAPELDLRLVSPGYMDTQMLPKTAEVRKKGVWDPKIVAQELWQWSLGPDIGGHKVYERHPSC